MKTCFLDLLFRFGDLRFAPGSWPLHSEVNNTLQYLQLAYKVVKCFLYK